VHDFLLDHHIPGVEQIDEQGYSRTLRTDNGFSIVNVKPLLNEHAFELRVSGAHKSLSYFVSGAPRF
jgi:AlkA N-terminal domain